MSLISKHLFCRGLKTVYLEGMPLENTKEILFFIHGCPDSPEIWTSLMEKFVAEGYLVLAPALRGVGGSDAPRDGKIARYGKDSLSLDHLEILSLYDQQKPITVICHDIGSVSGWELARKLGPRLKKLVAINSPDPMILLNQFRKMSQLKKSWYIFIFQTGKLVEYIFSRYRKTLAKNTLKLGRFPDITPESIQTAAQNLPNFLPHYRAAFLDLPKRFFKPDVLIEKPRIICSQNDPFLNVPSARDLKNVAKFPEIRVLEGGHWLFLDKEEDLFRLIQKE